MRIELTFPDQSQETADLKSGAVTNIGILSLLNAR